MALHTQCSPVDTIVDVIRRLHSSPRRGTMLHLVMKIVPADTTITELKKRAAEYEEKAKKEPAPIATRLREKAKLCRDWVAALKSGKWMS